MLKKFAEMGRIITSVKIENLNDPNCSRYVGTPPYPDKKDGLKVESRQFGH